MKGLKQRGICAELPKVKSARNPEPACLARQAIYDRDKGVFGYELLYRQSSSAQEAVISDADAACSETIVSAVCDIGLENLVDRARAFVNLSHSVLLGGQISVLPSARVVVEVLEDVPASARVRATLEALRLNGYTIALDDFELSGTSAGLIDLADIIKVDVLGKSIESIAEQVRALRERSGAKLLAEKVETHEVFAMCRELGFDYFQGFFLCKPQIVENGRLPRYRTGVLELLSALEDPTISMAGLESLVQRDATLSYKLLRLLNSSMMGLRCQVDSIGHATVLIGQRRLKRWATLIALAGFDDCPDELLNLALIRARMCEAVAGKRGVKNTDPYFTVGLFSALDAMSGIEIQSLVEQMPLARDVREALTVREGEMGSLMKGVLEFERGDFGNCAAHGYDRSDLATTYVEAVQWADQTRRAL